MPHANPPAVYQLSPSAMQRCTEKSNVSAQDIGGSVGEAEYNSAADFCTDGTTKYGRVLVHRCDPPMVVLRRKGQLPICAGTAILGKNVAFDYSGTPIGVLVPEANATIRGNIASPEPAKVLDRSKYNCLDVGNGYSLCAPK